MSSNNKKNNQKKNIPAPAKNSSVQTAGKSGSKAVSTQKAPANVIDVKETARIAAILTAICLIIALALAGTNMLTKDIIAQAAAEAKAATCYEVIPADDYVYLSDHFEGYDDCDVYLALHEGRVVGAAITTSAKGYGGAVTVMTGINENGCVTGVRVLEHSETAGLGANAAKTSFLDQYITGEEAPRPQSFAVSKDGGEIDAVTAATISSRAVTASVNEALDIFARLEAGSVIGAQINAPELPAAPSSTDQPAAGQLPESTAGAANTEGGEDIG